MWLEAILTRDDLDALVTKLLPLTIDIGTDGDHVSIASSRDLALVVDQGMRLRCEVKVRWSVLGIQVPLTIHDVIVMMRPEIAVGADGREALDFRLFLEHADFAGLPTMIDEHLTDKINEVLSEKKLALSWGFAEMLTASVRLPPSLRPLDTLSLAVAWGKVKVTEEALVMAISFHSSVTRDGEGPASDVAASEALPPAPAPAPEPEPTPEVLPPRSMAKRRAPLVAQAAMYAGVFLLIDLGLRSMIGLARGVRR